ncbi:AzlD domain-containing protein [Arhodomonas sp. AD133]|uniref:AzlD domain-containing protein n=1 Tax=Arhodomonas sp. AD133 TaxID=3415009 RepID=UPI003EBBF5C5
MSETGVWLIILCAGVGTFALRLSFIQAVGHRGMPDWLRRPLRYVPAAVLSALVVPGIVVGGPEPLDPARLAGGAVAALVAWRTRNTLWVLAAGMVVLWAVSALLR